METNGKVAVVTGASAGIGRAIALRLGRQGARIALLARDARRLEQVRKDIEDGGGAALACPVDVSDAAAVEAAAKHIEDRLGPIGIWVNAAMATVFGRTHAVSPEDFRRAVEVTFLGGVHGTLAALRRFRERDAGLVLQVGSALSYRAIPLQAAYCASKFALRGFTDSVRAELAHDGSAVEITMVQLSAFNTPQFDWARNLENRRPQPLPPIFQPELAADAVLEAIRRPRREIWVGFPAVKAILGTQLLPGVTDRIMARQGFSGQLTGEREPPDREDNLWNAVPGNFGSHGRFDDRARGARPLLWTTTHRFWVGAAFLAATAVGAGLFALGAVLF